ncbi:MAG TPA: hypothetical protein PLF37_11700 [Planctomycetota bacterium]|nr:hypothetical protein [Planctomycetota bacterium]
MQLLDDLKGQGVQLCALSGKLELIGGIAQHGVPKEICLLGVHGCRAV